MQKTNVLIVDKSPLYRMGVTSLINRTSGYFLVGELDSIYNQTADSTCIFPPDIVLVEVSQWQDSNNNLESLRTLQQFFPRATFMAIVDKAVTTLVVSVLKAGVLGIITHFDSTEDFLAALNNIREGRPYLNKLLAQNLLHRTFARKRIYTQAA